MAHRGSSRALRWCVARVDASLVALEYDDGKIHGRALVVDAAERVVRSGKRTPITWPPSPRLPDTSEWIHAARVEDTQLAIPITLLVFRSKASANRSVESHRPAKRARRDGEMAVATRLFFFAISSGSSSSEWQLQSLGVVKVEGDPSAQQIHVMDGPSVVAFNTATSTLSLLQPRITGEDEYAFAVQHTNVALPSAVKAELLSCQFVGEEVTSTPHLLIQYAEVQEQLQEDDVAWYPPSEHQRQWAALPLLMRGTTNAVMLPCPYLPPRSVSGGFTMSESEQITSCAFVPPPSSSCSTAQSVTSSCTSTPRLRSSVVALFGMATGMLRVVSNDVLLASYVLAGVARHIQLTNAHSSSGSAIVAAISCEDSDRSFQLLSIDVWADRHHVVSPLQHFTFVGSMTELPFNNDDPAHVNRMLLLNDVASLANEDDCLALSLRKSVVLTCSSQPSGHVTSSCHRLKHRADQKTSKKGGADRHGAKEADGFQAIERVKVDKRDQRDFEAHHHTIKNHSSASEQQLEMLTKSLQERLRVGMQHADRLERVCNEKSKMVEKLNELLVASDDDYGMDPNGSDDLSVELAPVVTPDSSVDNSATTSSSIPSPRHRWLKQVGSLEKASVISFDRTRSRLHIALDIQARLDTKDDGSNSTSSNSAPGLSVFAVDCTKASLAMRSWSSVRYISRPHSLQDISDKRVSIDLTIELPPSFRRPKEHHFRLGLWLRVEPSDVLLNQTSTRLIGELAVDLTSLTEEVGYGSAIHTSHNEHLRPSRDDYLFVSAGSSLPETILTPRENSKLTQSQLQLVRPLFAVLTSEPPSVHAAHSHEDQRIDTLLRALPRDVVTMVNPLALSSLDVVQSLIHLLKSELDQACGLENHYATTEGEDPSPASQCQQLLSTQLQTDLRAVRVLNEWQRRIDFQSS